MALTALLTVGITLPARSYPVDPGRVTIAVFPFRDLTVNAFDREISAMIEEELARHEFIEIVPVGVFTKEGYEIEPLSLWTEMKGEDRRGGMLWTINPFLIEEAGAAADADLLLYGDMEGSPDGFRLNVFAVKEGESGTAWSSGFSGVREDELSLRAADMASALAEWVKAEYSLRFAEEDIRRCLGGMMSRDRAISRMRERLLAAPQSMPLHALLFDLYRLDRETHREDMLHEAGEMIRLMEKGGDADLPYLLSRDIDPFEVAAGAHERKEEWQEAILLREQALKIFPANFEVHKRALGESYYALGSSHEKEGRPEQAQDAYERALRYLTLSSEFYEQARDARERMQGR